MHQILVEGVGEPVHVDSARAMYWSGSGYHSRNDRVFSFEAELLRGDQLYVSVTQSERGEVEVRSTRFHVSTDQGVTWTAVENIPDEASLELIGKVSK